VTSAGDPGALAGLLDREELRDLVARYAFAVDDHDLDAVSAMFHPDAAFDRDGHLATGWPEIAETLGASMRGFQRMIHTPHAVVVELTGADTATGTSSGHGELVTRRGVVLAAYRYRDEFARHEGRWVFTRRAVRFLYATPADAYAETLASVDRVRFPGDEPRPSAIVPRAAPTH
jgi:ketosteroid isomerase-like protein